MHRTLTRPATPVDPLLQLLKKLSYREGDFVLASGERSSVYLDCRTTALHPEGLRLLGERLYEAARVYQPDSVGGMAVGAVPLVSAVLMAAAERGQQQPRGFFMRKAAKGYGLGRQFEGHLESWMRVVLLEDVITTGQSTRQVIDAISAHYPSIKIAAVLAIVNRRGDNPYADLGIPCQALYQLSDFKTA